MRSISLESKLRGKMENQGSSDTPASGSSIDWSSAFASTEFRSGLAEIVTQTMAQVSPPASQVTAPEVGTGEVSQPTTVAPPDNSQGTFIVAPSFVRAIGASTSTAGQSSPMVNSNLLTNSTANVPNLPQSFDHEPVTGPTLPLPAIGISSAFILGPGRPPIPPKLVTQILANKFIELSELLPENLESPQCESSSFTIEGGAIVPITKVLSKRKQEISDILTWVECFTSYITVISASFPSRARDLLSYMALIIRMAKRYTGNCWLNYDRAFRLEAAASNLREWSQLKPDLYSYHTSVSSSETYTRFATQSSNRREPQGSQSASEICRSWNTGACITPREFCRFRHRCNRPGCGGSHRRINCRELRDRSPQRPQNELQSRRARSK